MHNDHLEERIAAMNKKQYVDPVLEETKRIMREHKQERQNVKNKYITVGQASGLSRTFSASALKKTLWKLML